MRVAKSQYVYKIFGLPTYDAANANKEKLQQIALATEVGAEIGKEKLQ